MPARLWRSLFDLLFPPRCAGCGRIDYHFCPDCRQSVPWVTAPACPRCGRDVSFSASPSATSGERQAACVVCSALPLRMDGVRAAAEFRGAIRKALHAFKYDGRTELANPLAELMVAVWGNGLFPADCVVPVPLHSRRIQERGYNQATLLADVFAQETGLPVLPDALYRSRMTESQTSLGAHARRRNVDGAFTARPSFVRGRSILLVDDVCTTGSTLQACADALRNGGASKVYAITVARAGWDPASGAVDDSDRHVSSQTYI